MDFFKLGCIFLCHWAVASGQPTNSSMSLRSAVRSRRPVFYVLDGAGVFHREPSRRRPAPVSTVEYTVLDSGVLVPKQGEYGVKYNVQKNGDLVPDPTNRCIYTSSKPASYLKAFRDVLIPVVRGNGTMRVIGPVTPELIVRGGPSAVVPDTSCSGDVVLFVLHNSGVLERRPPDPYLPTGMKTTYSLTRDLVLTPSYHQTPASKQILRYLSGSNGNLNPCPGTCLMRSQIGGQVSFMLGESGRIFPVKEVKQTDLVEYYFNGRRVHCSHQFKAVQANSSVILLDDRKFELTDEGHPVAVMDQDGPRFTCRDFGHSVVRNKQLTDESLELSKGLLHKAKKKQFTGESQKPSESTGESQEPSESTGESQEPSKSTFNKPFHQVGKRDVYSIPEHTHTQYRRPENIHTQYRSPENTHTQYRRPENTHMQYRSPENTHTQYRSAAPYRQPYPSVQAETYNPPPASYDPRMQPLQIYEQPRPCPPPPNKNFVCDERGVRISIVPEVTNHNDVILYKLTCRGQLVRFPPCREPEYGFDVNFQLLLDTFTLVPSSEQKGVWLTYTLQPNGDLRPSAKNANTFVKSPASLVVFMLGTNNVLFVVEQSVNKDGSVTYFFENDEVYHTPKELNEPLKFYNTKSEPIFADVNGKTMFTCHSKRTVSAGRGSTWYNPNLSEENEKFSRDLFLMSPDNEKIPVVPCKGSKGVPVVFDLDSRGVFHKSPKDKKKWISLKSFCLLDHGIMLPTKDAKEFVYVVAKNGDLMPYVYPDNKLTSPHGYSSKYVGCVGGILLPIKIEIVNNYICYSFNNVIVYKKRSFCVRRNRCCFKNPCVDDFLPYEESAALELTQMSPHKKRKGCSSSSESTEEEKSNHKIRSSEESVERNQKYKNTCKCRGKCSCSKKNLEENECSSQESEEIKKQFKLFVTKEGHFVYYEKKNKLLVRHPTEEVPPYLKYTMGSFCIEQDRLKQAQFKDPDDKIINLMLEPNGDLLEDSRNIKHPQHDFYILAEDGSLIFVDAVKKGKKITFYKDGRKVFCTKVSLRDPLKVLDDPEPKNRSEEGPLTIPIPLKSMNIGSCESDEPCNQLKDSLKKLLKRDGADELSMHLEMTDNVLDDIRRWAEKRDKRRYGQLKKRHLLDFLDQQPFILPNLDLENAKL